MSPYERVVAALKAAGSRRQGNNWQCQSHDDRVPSLSVNLAADDSGTVLMHCHAGCTLVEATGAIGLTPADLFAGNGQMALFPKSRYSPIGLDVIAKTPPSAHRTLHVAGALGRYVDRWGGRRHVENTKQMLCVVLERKHRKAVRDYLELSPSGLWNDIKRWCEWGVAHECSTGLLTILVRDSESCPFCKSSLVGEDHPPESSSVGEVEPPQVHPWVTVLGTNLRQPTAGSLKSWTGMHGRTDIPKATVHRNGACDESLPLLRTSAGYG